MTLKFGMLRTINLGNFENVKVEFSIETEVDSNEFEKTKNLITAQVEEHIGTVLSKYNNKKFKTSAGDTYDW